MSTTTLTELRPGDPGAKQPAPLPKGMGRFRRTVTEPPQLFEKLIASPDEVLRARSNFWGSLVPLPEKEGLPAIESIRAPSDFYFGTVTAVKHKKEQDGLDRWVRFCNNTEAWDKFIKILHTGVRMTVDFWWDERHRASADFLWRYLLDARKTTWLLKWVKEFQGIRAALSTDDDRMVAGLKALIRFWFSMRWVFENLHIMTKALPKGVGNVFKVKDPMRLNRLAKFCWQMALIFVIAADLKTRQLSQGEETDTQRKMRRLRAIQCLGDSQTCLNMMQVPQMLSKAVLGREVAFRNSWLGLCGMVAGIIQCYFVYPAKPAEEKAR